MSQNIWTGSLLHYLLPRFHVQYSRFCPGFLLVRAYMVTPNGLSTPLRAWSRKLAVRLMKWECIIRCQAILWHTSENNMTTKTGTSFTTSLRAMLMRVGLTLQLTCTVPNLLPPECEMSCNQENW